MAEAIAVSPVEQTLEYVKQELSNEGSGHDWWHIYRVWKTSKHIASKYIDIDYTVVELSALLHDIADWKNHNGDFTIGALKAKKWLNELSGLSSKQISHICYNVENISFKGKSEKKPDLSLEGQIVQDADRLDATGAIGVARTFTYGGSIGRLIFDPGISPIDHKTVYSYVNNLQNNTSINHFYEKLLLLKDLMNTKYGKELAIDRHKFLQNFLSQFYLEMGEEQ